MDFNKQYLFEWSRFTTFCVQTGVVAIGGTSNKRSDNTVGDFSLEQYVIEYGEDFLFRDRVLSAYRMVAQMKYVPENRKILVHRLFTTSFSKCINRVCWYQLVAEEADSIQFFDDRFHVYSVLQPAKLQIVTSVNKGDAIAETVKSALVGHVPKPIIYDVIYLSKRDLYAYTSSDHSITVCKELSSMGGKKINYLQYNRFFHTLLHLRLCWSPKHDTLCSAASDCGREGFF